MKAEAIDRLGNNAIIECTECKKPFIVSRPPIYKKPRNCPHCGKTRGHMNDLNIISIDVNDEGGAA